jgi:hypothetical protein
LIQILCTRLYVARSMVISHHVLVGGYIDLQVNASQSRFMSNSTEDNMRPLRQIKTPMDRIVNLKSKVGQMHKMLLVSLLTIMI